MDFRRGYCLLGCNYACGHVCFPPKFLIAGICVLCYYIDVLSSDGGNSRFGAIDFPRGRAKSSSNRSNSGCIAIKGCDII